MVKQFCDNPYGSCQVRERGEGEGGQLLPPSRAPLVHAYRIKPSTTTTLLQPPLSAPQQLGDVAMETADINTSPTVAMVTHPGWARGASSTGRRWRGSPGQTPAWAAGSRRSPWHPWGPTRTSPPALPVGPKASAWWCVAAHLPRRQHSNTQFTLFLNWPH